MRVRQQTHQVLAAVQPFFLTAGAIIVAIRLGHLFTAGSETAALVWPPAGISIAALLMYGWRYWPAVATGTLAGYLSLGEPPAFALTATAGNTLEPLLGYWLLTRVYKIEPRLVRLRDLLGLLVLSGVVSTMLSATAVTLALGFTSAQPWPGSWHTWTTLWLGNAFGVVIFAPLLLRWVGVPLRRIGSWQLVEAGFAGMLLVWANVLIFGNLGVPQELGYSLAFTTVPLLLWAGLRLGMHGATLGSALTAMVAVISTANGAGPFTSQGGSADLPMVWMYIMVVSVSTQFLGATVAERRQAFAALSGGIQAASRTQRSLLPAPEQLQEIERETGLQISYTYSASQTMGGDVLGLIMLNPDEVCLYVADVSGHGIQASLAAVSLHAFVQATLSRTTDPGELVPAINNFCSRQLPDEMFATMTLLIYEPSRMNFRVLIAGHTPLIICNSGGWLEFKDANLPAFGVFDNLLDAIVPLDIGIGAGDRLLLYSDGVTETRNDRGEMYAHGQLQRLLKSLNGTPNAEVPGRIVGALEEWRGSRNATDDITVVSIALAHE